MCKEFWCDDCEEWRDEGEVKSITTWRRIGPDELEYINYCCVCDGDNIEYKEREDA